MHKIVAVGILCSIAVSDVKPAIGQAFLIMGDHQMLRMNDAKSKVWLSQWERNILSANAMRYCATETGEGIGWGMLPFLRGFYYGYLATRDLRWVDLLVRCTDLRIKEGSEGNLMASSVGLKFSWRCGADMDNLDDFYADSMLGEAMALTPVVLMAIEIWQPLVERKVRREG